MARITNPRTGNGDSGYSEVHFDIANKQSLLVSKSDSVLFLQNYLELSRNGIAKYLLRHSVTEQEDQLILQRMVRQELNNLCGEVYLQLSSRDLCVSEEFVGEIERRIDYFTQELDDQEEFIVSSDMRYLDLDDVRIRTRINEHLLWVLIDNLRNKRLSYIVLRIAKFMNMFSDYVYQLNLYENYKQNVDVFYWEAGSDTGSTQ